MYIYILRVIFTHCFYGHIVFLHILPYFVQYFPVLILFCSFCEINYSETRKITQISKIIVLISKIKVFVLFFLLPLQTKTNGNTFLSGLILSGGVPQQSIEFMMYQTFLFVV